MNIYWLRPFWFGQRTFTDTSVHKDYFTITFENRPNIAKASAQVPISTISVSAICGPLRRLARRCRIRRSRCAWG